MSDENENDLPASKSSDLPPALVDATPLVTPDAKESKAPDLSKTIPKETLNKSRNKFRVELS
jgi:hypothetical protein